jgi:hypothetical protein
MHVDVTPWKAQELVDLETFGSGLVTGVKNGRDGGV